MTVCAAPCHKFFALGKVVVLYSIVKGTGISQKDCSEIWQPLMAGQTIRARKNLKKLEEHL